jgi:hypothetical protein
VARCDRLFGSLVFSRTGFGHAFKVFSFWTSSPRVEIVI